MPINNIDENNRARDRLIAQLRTNHLIGCTGAGVSVWAGYRSWRGVIERLAAEVDLRRHGEVNTKLVLENHGGDLLLCARRLGNDLGEPAFTDFIRAEFGPTGARVDDVLLRIAALPLRHALTRLMVLSDLFCMARSRLREPAPWLVTRRMEHGAQCLPFQKAQSCTPLNWVLPHLFP